MLNTVWQKIIDNRCDDIGMMVTADKKQMKLFDAVIEAQETLRAKLPPEDQYLLDHLEEAQASLMGVVEREYYLAGLRDGTGLKQLLTGESMAQVTS